jgi:hypothetical protein
VNDKRKHIETLCYNCKNDYEEAGFKLRKIPGQKYKDQCTHCQRGRGWDYEIKQQNGITKPF